MKSPELHLFVIWDKGRKAAEARILDDIRRRFDVVCEKEVEFPCKASEGYCRFYGSRGPDLEEKVRFCGDGPCLVVIVRVRDEKTFVDRDGSSVNAMMFSSKKAYRRWCGGLFRVHGTLRRDEFERDVMLLTGHSAEEWERGVPGEIRMNLPPLDSLPVKTARLGGAKRARGAVRDAAIRLALAAVPSGKIRDRLRRKLACKAFGPSVRRKASSVGKGLVVSGPCSVTGTTSIGENVSLGGLFVFGGGKLSIGDGARIGADVNIVTRSGDGGGVSIGDEACIGPLATVLPGARIGAMAVIRPGAVVEGEVPPYSTYGDVPDGGDAHSVAAAMSGIDVLETIADRRSGLLHRCVLSGTWHGRPCIVKWTNNDPESLANEYEVGKAFYAASSGLSPEMYSLWRDGDYAVCVMERMSGRLLSDYMKDISDDAEKIRDMARQVDGLLVTMRRIGMCHRDLHAGNIFVTDDGTAKLFDFQNSIIPSGRPDPLSHALRASRAYLYKYRSAERPVIGLFNDRMHLLAQLGEGNRLRKALEDLCRDGDADCDYYCPPGVFRALRFMLRSVGVAFKMRFSHPKGAAADKLREKSMATVPTLRYWMRHGVTGKAGFVGGRRKER